MSRSEPLLDVRTLSLKPFVDAGELGAAEVHVARLIDRTAGGIEPDVLLAAALAARAPSFGHVCVDLAQVAEIGASVERDVLRERPAGSLPWPDPATWMSDVTASRAARDPDDPRGDVTVPLVLDGSRLYLERYWRYEQQVTVDLLARARSAGGLTEPSADVESLLDDLFPPENPSSSAQQRQAVRLGMTRRLVVIAGGPGTGKTYTVARLLAAMRRIERAGVRSFEVAMAAPTGKAATRITETIRADAEAADLSPDERTRLLATEAGTLHRLLRSRPGEGFAHNRSNPLPHDLVIVDETSMVSLPLMARLLDALRPEATLVLVGDPFQLASVDAGAVLGEIISVGTRAIASATGPIPDSIVVLERVHRFGSDSSIAALADTIRTGDADAAMALLRSDHSGELTWVDPADERGVSRLQHEAAEVALQVVRSAQVGDSETGLELAMQLKVLCATRLGPLGSFRWNDEIERRLANELPEAGIDRRWYVGRPVTVTGNDYLTRLFNGDVGLVVAGSKGPVVAFRGPEGQRELAMSQLGDVETWWSMTIHKSQGSEFSRVIIALPPPPSPVLTRELLYTAVTRAKHQVTLVASEESLRVAIASPAVRASGLGSKLASGC